jgi:hypothetical protein
LQTVDDFLVERAQLADLLLQDFFDVVPPERAEVVEQMKPCGSKAGILF